MKFLKIITLLIAVSIMPLCAEAKSNDKKDDNIIDAVTVKEGITVTEIEESGKVKFEFTGSHAESIKKNRLKVHNLRAVAYYNKNKRELTTDQYVEIIKMFKLIHCANQMNWV